MNIKELIELLKSIKVSNLEYSNHFKVRAESRSNIPHFSDINHLHSIIKTQEPVGIVDQGNNKFLIYYEMHHSM